MAEDRCICCGAVIPEGRQVCQKCESMREKEAIEELKPNKNFPFDDYVSEGARELAINALEKQIPKKVIGIEANLLNRYCPSCNEWAGFELKKNMKYCPNCGQKLDWSE